MQVSKFKIRVHPIWDDGRASWEVFRESDTLIICRGSFIQWDDLSDQGKKELKGSTLMQVLIQNEITPL